ncbi:MAG: hypothetical protein ACI8W7_002422, partial [Gammaproteobacteria bacterium]
PGPHCQALKSVMFAALRWLRHRDRAAFMCGQLSLLNFIVRLVDLAVFAASSAHLDACGDENLRSGVVARSAILVD